MATVNRPPFYVPRPAVDTYWSGTPVRSSIIPFLTKQKFFGAGGQVPTKRWSQIYTFDDPSVWYAAPVPSTILGFLTKQKMFGQGGQVPMKQWRYDYDVGETQWYATPLGSDLLHPLLTAAGQVRSREWHFGYDDPSVWSGAPTASDLLVPILTRKPVTSQIRFYNDDSSVWFPWTNRNLASLFPSVSPFVNYTWRFNNDDSAVWSGSPQDSSTIPFFTVGGKPPIKHWNYDLDDSSVWQLTHQRNLIPAAGAPTIAQRWNYNFDDTSGWQWQAPSLIALQLVPYTVGPSFADNYDEPPVWSWNPPRDQPLLTVQASPFSPRFQPGYDEPPGWSGGIRSVPLTISTSPANPFTTPAWRFGYGDPSLWTGQSQNAFFIQHQPIPFISTMWVLSFNIPQDTPTTISSQPSAVLYFPTPAAATLIQRTLTGVGL